jgi:hypothetical protein
MGEPVSNTLQFRLYDSSGTEIFAMNYGIPRWDIVSGYATWSTTLNLADGWYTWKVRTRFTVNDDPWNYTDWTYAEFGVDTTPPTLNESLSGTLGANGWYTSNVELAISASDSYSGLEKLEYRVGDGAWVAYDQPLSISDGQYQIEYKATDKVGHQASLTLTVKVDTAAPIIEVSVPSFTNSTFIVVDLSRSSDATSGLSQIKVWLEGENEPAAWESYAASKSVVLPTGDGSKTVYAKVKDTAGHESSTASYATTLDQTPPIIKSVSINGGAPYTNSQSVMFNLLAEDALAGVSEVGFSIDGANWSWQEYSQEKSFDLPAGDGVKIVYVKVRDRAGNESDTISSGITLDTVPPTALGIKINGGASSTNSTSVTLALSADDDGSGVAKMQFSIDGSSWTSWETYSALKSFTLPAGDGEKTIYFRVRDKAGNLSSAISATIVLETPKLSPPIPSSPTPPLPPSPQPSPVPTETSAETEEWQTVKSELVIEPIFELQLPSNPIANTDGSIIVIVRISNPSDVAVTKRCELHFNGSSVPIDLTVEPGENKEITITLDVPENLKGEFSVVLADDGGEELASGTLTLAGTSEPEPSTALQSPESSPSMFFAALTLGATGMTLTALKLVRGKSHRTRRSPRSRKNAMTRAIEPPTESTTKLRKYDELMERAKIHKEYRENSVD